MSREGFGDFAAVVHAHIRVFPCLAFAQKGLFGHGAIRFIQGGVVERECLDHGIEIGGKGGEVFALVLDTVDFADVAAVELELGFVGEPGLALGGIEAAGVDAFDNGQEVFGTGQRHVAVAGGEGVFYLKVMGNDFVDVFGPGLCGGVGDQRYADQRYIQNMFFHN